MSAKVRPNGHLSYCPMLMPSQSFCCFFVVLSGSPFVVYIVFYYLLTLPVCFLESPAKDSKKKESQPLVISFRILV